MSSPITNVEHSLGDSLGTVGINGLSRETLRSMVMHLADSVANAEAETYLSLASWTIGITARRGHGDWTDGSPGLSGTPGVLSSFTPHPTLADVGVPVVKSAQDVRFTLDTRRQHSSVFVADLADADAATAGAGLAVALYYIYAQNPAGDRIYLTRLIAPCWPAPSQVAP